MNNTNPTAIIIDDEPSACELLESLLAELNIRVLDHSHDAKSGVEAILNVNPDLVFLDIELPDHKGFYVLEEIRYYNIHPYVIFTTAFNQYAIKAIKYSPFDYLLKPISFEELTETLNRYKNDVIHNSFDHKVEMLFNRLNVDNKIKFNTRNGFILLDPNEILYCQADGNYTDFVLVDGKKELVSLNIGTIEEMLPKTKFFKIKRSTIINLKYLARFERSKKECILYSNNVDYVLSVSSRRIHQLESASNNYQNI